MISVVKRLGVGLPDIEAYLNRPLREGDTIIVYNEPHRRVTIWKVDSRGVIEKSPTVAFGVGKNAHITIRRRSDIAIKVTADAGAVFGVENIPEFTFRDMSVE